MSDLDERCEVVGCLNRWSFCDVGEGGLYLCDEHSKREAVMSEHPELREALAYVFSCEENRLRVGWPDKAYAEQIADALLAGPVGKLQAELAEAKAELVQLREEKACQFVIRSDEGTAYCSLNNPPDPERIRREAIGERALDIAAKARPVVYPGTGSGIWAAGYNHALDTVLAAGESAVTGEATSKQHDDVDWPELTVHSAPILMPISVYRPGELDWPDGLYRHPGDQRRAVTGEQAQP